MIRLFLGPYALSRRIVLFKKALLTILYFIYSTSLYSGVSQESVSLLEPWSATLNVGYLGGEAKEYVYEEGLKVSQLNWKINHAAIIEGSLNYKPLSWLSLNLRGWITLGHGQARMDDYDWLDPNQSQWTDWSYHEQTNLSQANEIDLYLQTPVIESRNIELNVSAGYQRTLFSYLALGGCYQYNNQADTGCFVPNQPSIGYKQVFNTPYLGVSATYVYQRYETNLFFKYSPWMLSRDVDQHYARNITFKEWGYASDYYALCADLGYYFKKYLKGFIAASYNRFEHARADTEILDNDTGERFYALNTAGIENTYYNLSLGITYKA